MVDNGGENFLHYLDRFYGDMDRFYGDFEVF